MDAQSTELYDSASSSVVSPPPHPPVPRNVHSASIISGLRQEVQRLREERAALQEGARRLRRQVFDRDAENRRLAGQLAELRAEPAALEALDRAAVERLQRACVAAAAALTARLSALPASAVLAPCVFCQLDPQERPPTRQMWLCRHPVCTVCSEIKGPAFYGACPACRARSNIVDAYAVTAANEAELVALGQAQRLVNDEASSSPPPLWYQDDEV